MALARARNSGYLEYEFKLRLLLAEMDLFLGNNSTGLTELAPLKGDASRHGFGLVARKVDADLNTRPRRERTRITSPI